MSSMPLIERPDLQSRRERLVFGSLTLMLWGFWMYLWMPLLSLLAWMAGFRILYVEMLLPENLDYGQQLLLYGQIVILILLTMLLWSRYNVRRFRGKERRRMPDRLGLEQEAEYNGISSALLVDLKNARNVVIHHDAEDRITTLADRLGSAA